jgi:hypothetical protein
MTSIDARLLVALKGADLAASTARLALVDKMGYGGRLLALKRFDFFRFQIDSPAGADATIDTLQRILDRQSTFYNRNKHLYSLSCGWDTGDRVLGVARDELRRQWARESLQHDDNKSVTDLVGKISTDDVILKNSGRFRVEVLVEDDDQSARVSIAAKIRGGLSEVQETRGAEVTCFNRATVWWLAVLAPDAKAAEETARDITVTTRRDRGLLMNPNYQVAEFLAVEPLALESG